MPSPMSSSPSSSSSTGPSVPSSPSDSSSNGGRSLPGLEVRASARLELRPGLEVRGSLTRGRCRAGLDAAEKDSEDSCKRGCHQMLAGFPWGLLSTRHCSQEHGSPSALSPSRLLGPVPARIWAEPRAIALHTGSVRSSHVSLTKNQGCYAVTCLLLFKLFITYFGS